MTGQEIANLLMEKGRVTNDVYYSIYYVLTLSPEHEKYDNELLELLNNKEYSIKVLNIERGKSKPRRDIVKWSDVRDCIEYMYDDKFFEHLHLKRLVIDDKIPFPMSTFERMLRYAKYGYFPCKETKLKIIFVLIIIIL